MHNDYLSIFRENRLHHATQREIIEDTIAFDGPPSDFPSTTTFENHVEAMEISHNIGLLQYRRYQARGGRRSLERHNRDFRYNSPNHHNMAPGQDYRTWFHGNITSNYHSLGEATTVYNDWLTDPDYNPTRRPSQRRIATHIAREDYLHPPYLPYARSTSSSAPQAQQQTQPPPQPPGHSSDDSTMDIHTQTFHTSAPTTAEDPDAVLDSGAMMTTVPRNQLTGTPWEHNIRPAHPGTTIRYGNMETEPVEETTNIGDYPASIVPARFRTALISIHDIVSAGHTVLFTNQATIIEDIEGRYALEINRTPASREWRAPLQALQQLTDLRIANPLSRPQPHLGQSHSS